MRQAADVTSRRDALLEWCGDRVFRHHAKIPCKYETQKSRSIAMRGGCIRYGVLAIATAVAACMTAFGAERAASGARCLADGDGYFRARILGSIKAEIDWRNEGTECSGATRP